MFPIVDGIVPVRSLSFKSNTSNEEEKIHVGFGFDEKCLHPVQRKTYSKIEDNAIQMVLSRKDHILLLI